MVKDYSDSKRGNPLLPLYGLLFSISSKVFFYMLHQLWSTGWNEKKLSGSTMKDWSDNPSHHELHLAPQSDRLHFGLVLSLIT